MSQPLLLGLLSAAAMIICGLLGLLGVLWKATRDFNLGKRAADTAEQSAESERNAKLSADNKNLRAEITAQWEANQKLRQANELAETQHESECDAAAAKEKTLLLKIDGLLGDVAALTGKLDQVSAEAGIALRAQERAEGGLQQARRTISQFSPGSQISPGNHPEDHPDPQT
jgi:septal ring factor EnvC (AmiA/AmiB activator)